MGYITKNLSKTEAMECLKEYPYILVYEKSRVMLGNPEDISINEQDLIEARAFSKNAELHLFKCEKEWVAVLTEDDGDAESITRSYQLSNRFSSAGGEIVVKDYLSADEDGQVYVKLTRLCGLE